MLTIFPIMLFLSSFFFKNSRILFLLWLLLFIILFGFNTYNPDYLTYANIYRLFTLNKYDGQLGDLGFIFLINQAIDKGLNYSQFLFYYSTLTIALLGFGVRSLSRSSNLVMAYYLIYPFTINVVQLRSFLSSIIVFIGVYFMYKYKNGIWIFIFLLCLASSIHFSTILYAILLLSKVKDFKKLYAYLLISAIIFIFLYASRTYLTIPLLTSALNKYFFSNLEFKGWIFMARVLFFRLIPVFFLHALYIYFKDSFKVRDVFLMKCTNLIMLFSMVFELVNSEFERFARLGYLIFYIVLFNIIFKFKNFSNTLIVFVMISLYFIGNFFFQNFYRSSNEILFFDSVFKAIFKNNFLN